MRNRGSFKSWDKVPLPTIECGDGMFYQASILYIKVQDKIDP
jgi:hypothetical protein